jgi:hypothetical protein
MNVAPTAAAACLCTLAVLRAQVPPEDPESPVPDLLALLRSDEPALRLEAADRLGMLHGTAFRGAQPSSAVGPLLTACEQDPDADVALTAAISLWSLGPPPAAVVAFVRDRLPAWESAGGTRATWERLRAALSSPRPENAVASFVEPLLELAERSPLQRAALTVLGALGDAAATERLRALLPDVPDRERWQVAIALAASGAAATLAEHLGADDPRLRLAAALAHQRGTEAALPAQAVMPWLADHRRVVRRAAIRALPRVADPPATAVRTLAEQLPDPALRAAAHEALVALGRRAAPAVPELLRQLDRGDREIEGLVLDELAAIGSAASRAVEPLVAFALDGGEEVDSQHCGRTLAKIDPARATTLLRRAFEADAAAGRDGNWPSARTLCGLGEPAAAQLGAFVSAVEHGSVAARTNALAVLQSFGPRALPALPFVLQQLGSDDRGVFSMAAMVVHAIGPAAADAVPVLESTFGKVDDNRRLQLLVAAAALGSAAEGLLLRGLDDRDWMNRRQAGAGLAVLPDLSAAGAAKISAMLDLAENGIPSVRNAPWRHLVPPLVEAESIAPELAKLVVGKIDHPAFYVHLLAAKTRVRALCPALAQSPLFQGLVAASDRAATKAALVDREALAAWVRALEQHGDAAVRAAATTARELVGR